MKDSIRCKVNLQMCYQGVHISNSQFKITLHVLLYTLYLDNFFRLMNPPFQIYMIKLFYRINI